MERVDLSQCQVYHLILGYSASGGDGLAFHLAHTRYSHFHSSAFQQVHRIFSAHTYYRCPYVGCHVFVAQHHTVGLLRCVGPCLFILAIAKSRFVIYLQLLEHLLRFVHLSLIYLRHCRYHRFRFDGLFKRYPQIFGIYPLFPLA